MHTIFLGHVKSNYDLCSKWLSAHELFGTFGKQVNKYLEDIKKLRCRKFFDAYPLANTSWGTGVWVSENYLFWCRAQKLFLLLPAIHQSKRVGGNEFDAEVKMVLRFTMAAHACMSRLMSEDRIVPDMEHVIMLYLDTMVEMDRWIIKNLKKKKQTPNTDEGAEDVEEGDTGEGTVEGEDDHMDHVEPDNNSGSRNNNGHRNKRHRQAAPTTGGGKKKTRGRNSFRKKPAFTKSNSLGLLKAGRDHNYFGPAKLHWEGGWAGERKITGAKQWMGIKRANADWQTISIKRMYQMEALAKLQEQLEGGKDSRDMEMTIYVYKTEQLANEAVATNMPLCGLVDKNGLLWIACRPCDKGTHNRSSILLLQVRFDDLDGEDVCGMCYCAPLNREISETRKHTFTSLREMHSFVDQYVLMLPRLDEKGEVYQNSYYAIGNKWTERVASGDFLMSTLSHKVFQSWLE